MAVGDPWLQRGAGHPQQRGKAAGIRFPVQVPCCPGRAISVSPRPCCTAWLAHGHSQAAASPGLQPCHARRPVRWSPSGTQAECPACSAMLCLQSCLLDPAPGGGQHHLQGWQSRSRGMLLLLAARKAPETGVLPPRQLCSLLGVREGNWGPPLSSAWRNPAWKVLAPALGSGADVRPQVAASTVRGSGKPSLL